jgi:hypothetical protein
VNQITLPEGVTALVNEDAVVFHCAAPTVEAEPVAGEAAAGEPEVLKEKKPEEGADKK